MLLEILDILIPTALYQLGETLGTQIGFAIDQIAEDVAETYRQTIIGVGAVDSTHFVGTVHVEEGSEVAGWLERLIKSEAFYSGIVETGWINRGRGQASYPGRHPAAITIALSRGTIRDALDDHLGQIGIGV